MNTEQAIARLTDVIRRKHLALSTEHSYCAWVRRYCDSVRKFPTHWRSEQKVEQFLTALAKTGIAASTQNQAFNAIVFFYQANRVPVALPQQLAMKYPAAQFDWNWAWLFPAHQPCLNPRTGKRVRWRFHEVNIQRAIRKACRKSGLLILPHELRHAYATHCLNRGTNPRAIQEVMGHKSLETTMGYLHAEALSVASPLD